MSPDPNAGRAVPNLPTGGPKLSDEARQALGAAFQRAGREYHEVRPGYPGWVADFLLEPLAVPHAGGSHRAHAAVDLGAGTGLFTRDLVARHLAVTAVEPSASMRQVLAAELPTVTALDGTAEATGLPSASADLVSVAQAWHWMDPVAASAEMARVLRTGGVLGLVWNQLDVTVPWVHRLARIMHSGDVQRNVEASSAVGPGFSAPVSREERWEDTVTPEALFALCHSRSYYLRASEAVRAKVDANLSWYLFEHLRHTPGERLALPYVCLAVRRLRL